MGALYLPPALTPNWPSPVKNGKMRVGNLTFETENPSASLRQILADYKSPRFDYLPSFTGGLVGYFSYDYLGYSEPAVRTCARTRKASRTRI